MDNLSNDHDSQSTGIDECSKFPLLNLTDESTAEVYLLNKLTGKVVIGVMFTILAFGVPGNLAFLFVVFRVQHMRNATNMYLTSLAIGDLSFLSSSIFTYFFYFNNSVRTHLTTASVVGCVGAFVLPYFTYFLSTSTVTLVTLDKYNAVCNPLSYIQRPNKQRAIRLIIGSWVVAVLLAGLVMLRYARLSMFCALWPDADKYRGLPVVLGYCVPVSPGGLIIGHLVEAVVFVVALVANAIMYVRIILHLSARVNSKKRLQQTMSVQAAQIRNQVSRLLITFGTVFFLCQSTFVAISLANIVEYLLGKSPVVTWRKLVLPLTVSHIFVFLNSAINPVIYNLTSRIYRQAFQQVLCSGPCSTERQSSLSRIPITRQNMQDNGFENVAQAEELGISRDSKL